MRVFPMAALAQSVEHWIVIPGVTGSIPVCRPKQKAPQGMSCGAFPFPGLGLFPEDDLVS